METSILGDLPEMSMVACMLGEAMDAGPCYESRRSMSLPPYALELARRNLGLDAQASLAVGKIERGGSDREFYRVRGGGADPFILVIYGSGRRENAHYAAIADFLHQHQVAVPRLLFHDADAAVIAMQDLGGRDLWSYRASPWEVRRSLYQSALR